MKKVIGLIISVAILATLLNDAGAYLAGWNNLDVIAQQCAITASSSRSRERDDVAIIAAQYAASQGATVYLFDQNDTIVHVWVEMPIPTTWVLGRATALYLGQPIDTPYKIHTEKTATWR
ncbi:MAG: hypothetical protein KJ747_00630 [Actinobacteria bacterium]|nr:hypothetical protein [Actinomycetota bacterium]MCG2807823.1 hypothetical protein [Coriobacteriia bacterium]